MANSQKLALKASKAPKVSLADKGLKEILAHKDLEDILELLAHKALKDHLVNEDLKAIEDLKALLDKMELYHLIN